MRRSIGRNFAHHWRTKRSRNPEPAPQLNGSGSNPVGKYECIDVRWSHPDGVEHADVSQFTERAEPVHRVGGDCERGPCRSRRARVHA
jgi:hypothetical protein